MQQETMNMIKFAERFQTEKQCREALFNLRWPEGFVCPKCGHREFYLVTRRELYHCRRCEHQESVTAHTIFHGSHTPLTKWFIALMLAVDKRGVSAVRLAGEIDVSYPTAWLMLHKIREAMSNRDSGYMLSKIVEMDDAYFGAPDEGGKRGRGTDKTPAVIAVQVDKQGRPQYAKAAVVDNLQGETLLKAAHEMVEVESELRTDGYKPYQKLSDNQYNVQAEKFDPKGNPGHLLWLHKIISNLKAFIAGTYHGLDKKHLQRYLDEFTYRFNRRKYQSQLFMRLLNACAATSTITYKDLTADNLEAS
ncbi:DDE transposase [Synergistales bacterium]|nr:DDE transposase [Synergistales bacterium]